MRKIIIIIQTNKIVHTCEFHLYHVEYTPTVAESSMLEYLSTFVRDIIGKSQKIIIYI